MSRASNPEAADESGGVIERWRYGRRLLEAKTGRQQLPHGLLDVIVTATARAGYDLSRVEVQRRVKLATDRGPSLDDAADSSGKFGDLSWFLEQEHRIREADVRDRLARRRHQAVVDPGYVYVIEFVSGVVKVGKTIRPEARLRSHAGYAEAHGGGVLQSWVSEQIRLCGEAEQELIGYCKRRGELAFGREYFRGISFEEAQIGAEMAADLAVMEFAYRAEDGGSGGNLTE